MIWPHLSWAVHFSNSSGLPAWAWRSCVCKRPAASSTAVACLAMAELEHLFFLCGRTAASAPYQQWILPGCAVCLKAPCDLRSVYPAQLSPVQCVGTPKPAPNSTEATCLAVARDLQREARQWRDTQFSDWSARTLDSLGSIKMDQSGKLMDMDSRDGRIRLHYNENLVTLLRQVSTGKLSGQLSSIRIDHSGAQMNKDALKGCIGLHHNDPLMTPLRQVDFKEHRDESDCVRKLALGKQEICFTEDWPGSL